MIIKQRHKQSVVQTTQSKQTRTHTPNLRRLNTPSHNNQQPTSIQACLLNSRSVNEKEDPIIKLLIDSDTDFMVLTETWLNDSMNTQLNALTPAGYRFEHWPRLGKTERGGVALV